MRVHSPNLKECMIVVSAWSAPVFLLGWLIFTHIAQGSSRISTTIHPSGIPQAIERNMW